MSGKVPELIWKFDHVAYLQYDEWLWWMYNILPFGWSIISKPEDADEKKV